MDTNPYFLPAYKGTKDFSQEDIHTANATGFGAAADDYAERGIDLNEQLVRNKPATFFMRVNSDAMVGAGIHNGDVVIVDRSLPATNGKVVIAVVDGEMLIRRYESNNNRGRLVPASRKFRL
jgi:DNA polymerase V